MSKFLTPLSDHQIGPKLWQLDADFKYESDLLGCVVTVPKGFITDYESCPIWFPIINSIFGGIADEPAVIHDWLYYCAITDRLRADQTLLEAMHLIPGLSEWKMRGIYEGLRLGGWYAWWQHRKAGHNSTSLKPFPQTN